MKILKNINKVINIKRNIINEKFKYLINLRNIRIKRPERETRFDKEINDSMKDLIPILITDVSSRLFFVKDLIKFEPLRNINEIYNFVANFLANKKLNL